MSRSISRLVVLSLSGLLASGCLEETQPPAQGPESTDVVEAAPEPSVAPVASLLEPVEVWEGGKVARTIEASHAAEQGILLLDLGEDWTPYLFTDGYSNDQKPLENGYRATYLALARGEFGNDPQGEQAKEDKYLELYGILPTLHLSRERMREASKL